MQYYTLKSLQTCMTSFLLKNTKEDLFYYYFKCRNTEKKKVLHICNNMRVSKFGENLYFCVNCPFDTSLTVRENRKWSWKKTFNIISGLWLNKLQQSVKYDPFKSSKLNWCVQAMCEVHSFKHLSKLHQNWDTPD